MRKMDAFVVFEKVTLKSLIWKSIFKDQQF